MASSSQRTNPDQKIVDVDSFYQPTHDEIGRQRFISALRNHATVNLRDALQQHYNDDVLPAYVRRHGAAPSSPREIKPLMDTDLSYRLYSSLRYNAQEMVYQSVISPVERAVPAMNAAAKTIAASRPAGGTLRLDPDLKIPNYVTALDVHLVPGCFHSEYTADDITQGMTLAQGGNVSKGANIHRKEDPGGVGRSVGTWISRKYPNFKPKRVLDIGTQSGKNLLPYIDIFPGIEAYGVDVSAPPLRYGHAKAEYMGYTVHFSQQNAEQMDFPDGMFDLIVSSFFFHEIPVAVTRKIIKECHRLLSPGGIMAHMELPPHKLCDPWLNFSWDWDTQNNNEPHYTNFRAQDPAAICAQAGFTPQNCLETTVPNVSSFKPDMYDKMISGEVKVPRHGRGGWFIFGGIKEA
ncbi:MAG: class I SAM-dependent methyltransferase [Rhodospirillaceae bacterium]|nr:class I SAM-dependent methyltransferase [Rhodospirillaceae bacterium]